MICYIGCAIASVALYGYQLAKIDTIVHDIFKFAIENDVVTFEAQYVKGYLWQGYLIATLTVMFINLLFMLLMAFHMRRRFNKQKY